MVIFFCFKQRVSFICSVLLSFRFTISVSRLFYLIFLSEFLTQLYAFNNLSYEFMSFVYLFCFLYIVFIKRIGYFMTDVIHRFRGFLVYGQICKGVCSVQLIFEYMQKKLKTKGLCWKLLSLQDADGTNISKT